MREEERSIRGYKPFPEHIINHNPPPPPPPPSSTQRWYISTFFAPFSINNVEANSTTDQSYRIFLIRQKIANWHVN